MPTNEILPFAIGAGANVEAQASYAAESFVSTGFVAGIAPSAGMNKLFRQTSLMSAVMAQWMADNQANNIVDTASVATLEGYFSSALRNKKIVTVTPVSDADVTISQAAADSDIIIIATGAWTTNHNVIVPVTVRAWDIVSTSAYIATIKTAAGTGVAVPAGLNKPLFCDGVNVVDPNTSGITQIQPFSATIAGNALTGTLSPTTLDFRSATLSSGSITKIAINSPLSLTVPSGATLGTVNAVKSRIAWLVINNLGTPELAVVNLAGGNDLDETTLITTTTISAAATAANVIYSATGRTGVPFRVVAYIDITEATAGTWATAPSLVQGVGGQSLAAMATIGYSQTWQNVTRNAGTTYYNDTGNPIMLNVSASASALNAAITITITINGFTMTIANSTAATGSTSIAAGSCLIPAGASYVMAHTNVGTYQYSELR